jgi:glycosyltransferase involved in cell wall biosynthesis
MGIDLSVVYGYPRKNETDPYSNLDFGIQVSTIYLIVGKRFLVWMSAMKYVFSSNLVIVQQSNTNIINYLLIPLRKLFGFKLAFWGHGINFQARNRKSFGERFKRYYSKHADYWFAYTELSKDAIIKMRFRSERIATVNNAINVNEAIATYDSITSEDTDALRLQFGITKDSNVGIFCSRLYHLKRINFLLKCLDKIRTQITDFHFIMVGSGEEEKGVKEFAERNGEWFHFVGPLFGIDKIRLFKLAQFQLMPGGVGLNILESFALLTPLITTYHNSHGPEMIYLENGINGIVTKDDLESYVGVIVDLLTDKTYLNQLIEGCAIVRNKYSIENMAQRFADGIQTALSNTDKRPDHVMSWKGPGVTR